MNQNSQTPKDFNFSGFFKEFTETYVILIAGIPAITKNLYPENVIDEPIELVSRSDKKVISTTPREIIKMVTNKGYDVFMITNMLSIMLVNVCMEKLKQLDIDLKKPEIEFLRHLRNAGSHGNIFNFYPKEPKLEANWGALVIDSKFKGKDNPLFGKQCFGNFIDCGDLLRLLKTIEIKYCNDDNK